MPSSLPFSWKSEKFRGAITTVVSGSSANFLNIALKSAGMSVQLSSFISLSIIGNFVAYILDIVFAKHSFMIKGRLTSVPYSNLMTRFTWLLRSFGDKYFQRFVITVLIDSIIFIAILEYSISILNQSKFMMGFKYRDVAVAGLVALITFTLYVNILRFDWAYSDTENPLLNILIIVWLTLLIVIYAMTKNNILYQPKVDIGNDVDTMKQVSTVKEVRDDKGDKVVSLKVDTQSAVKEESSAVEGSKIQISIDPK